MHLLVLSAFRPDALLRRAKAVINVSMHLLVLSAFRRNLTNGHCQGYMSQCTFWCSVLSDGTVGYPSTIRRYRSQCTFWCSVLSDLTVRKYTIANLSVSMHLLVLSAFRRNKIQHC